MNENWEALADEAWAEETNAKEVFYEKVAHATAVALSAHDAYRLEDIKEGSELATELYNAAMEVNRAWLGLDGAREWVKRCVTKRDAQIAKLKEAA